MGPLVKFIIFSTAFAKGGAFLSLPFLSVYLQKNFGASPALTGLIVGLNPATGMIMGFYGGYLSDLWGRRGILLASILLCSLSYFSFTYATQIWHFALANLILGASYGALQTSLRALVSDLTHPHKRPTAFRLHYFAINVGASVGPLVGAKLLLSHSSAGFLITGTLFLIYFITFIIFDKFTVNPTYEETRSNFSLKECVGILKSDTAFLLFICGSLLMSLTYSQIDTLLPQYLRNLMNDEGIKVFAWLLAANSITVMLGLYPATWATKKFGPLNAVIWGQVIMSVGFAAMSFVGTSPLLLILCMIFLTIGEIFAFSNWSIVVDSYAKNGLKGSYFGASGFGLIGNSIGPLLGGVFYQSGGAYFAFNFLAFISMCGTLLYLKAEKVRSPVLVKA